MRVQNNTIIISIWDSTEGFNSTLVDLVPLIKSGEYKHLIAVSVWEYEWGKWRNHIGVDRSEFEKLLIEYGIRLTIIYGSYGRVSGFTAPDPIQNTDIIYFPLYWLYQSAREAAGCSDINLNSALPEVPIVKLATSLSNKSHNHRCTTMDYLSKHDLLRYMNYSWIEKNKEYEFQYWEQKQNYLSDNYKDNLDSAMTPPVEVFSSAFEIIMESTTFGHFWTEKTFNAILRGRPFLIISKPGTNELLEQFGFKSYINELGLSEVEAEYIDQDDQTNSELYKVDVYIDRLISRLNNSLDQYKSNPQQLYDKLKPIADYNRKHMKKIIDNQECIPIQYKMLKEATGLTDRDLNLSLDLQF